MPTRSSAKRLHSQPLASAWGQLVGVMFAPAAEAVVAACDLAIEAGLAGRTNNQDSIDKGLPEHPRGHY